MAQPVAKLLIGFFVVAALLVVAAVVFTLSQPVPAPPPLPQPNGYDDFVKAGGMVTDNGSDYLTMGEEELRAFVKKNAEALKLARVGLGRECRVPLDFSATYSATNDTNIRHLAIMKQLAYSLTAEGKLAEMENRPADAAEAYLAVIRLGCAMSQGGLIIDSLVSIAIDTIGTARLEKLAPTLDAKQCREAASALEACEARRQSTDTIMRQERAWARRVWGFKGQIVRLLTFRALKQIKQGWVAKAKAQQTRTQSLVIQLAARAYELEKGERPKSLADLVPVYLKTIPQDPSTGTNMAYHP
jgi:hypothetical protein